MQEVVLPKLSLPNPFQQATEDAEEGTQKNSASRSVASSELPAAALRSSSSAGADSVPMPTPHIPTPFEEPQKSAGFTEQPVPSPFDSSKLKPAQSEIPSIPPPAGSIDASNDLCSASVHCLIIQELVSRRASLGHCRSELKKRHCLPMIHHLERPQ